jgi:hypothetical protein
MPSPINGNEPLLKIEILAASWQLPNTNSSSISSGCELAWLQLIVSCSNTNHTSSYICQLLSSLLIRDADCTIYGYSCILYGEHTASGCTVIYPYLHGQDHLTVWYSYYYSRYTVPYGVWDNVNIKTCSKRCK